MAEELQLITATTVVALFTVISIIVTAYLLSNVLLPTSASIKTRLFFVWHAFDALVHFALEGSFLYNCFFTYTTVDGSTASPYLPPNTYFLGHKDRIYGAEYGTNFFASLWMDYAKADKRWAGTDLTIISLELLTVFVVGPMAVWVCYGLWRQRNDVWFWMVVLATSELYGGFCTFAPEWLTGNVNLDGSNPLFLWVYLWLFNAGLWVAIPVWIIYESYGQIVGALRHKSQVEAGKKAK